MKPNTLVGQPPWVTVGYTGRVRINMNLPVILIAGTWAEARHWVESRRWGGKTKPTIPIIADTVNRLRGIGPGPYSLVYYGTYAQRKDLDEIHQQLALLQTIIAPMGWPHDKIPTGWLIVGLLGERWHRAGLVLTEPHYWVSLRHGSSVL